MIRETVVISAPSARANYGLRYLSNNHNQVAFVDNGRETRLLIGLCDVQEATFKDAEKALAYYSLAYLLPPLPVLAMARYILEDGQSILHVTYEGHPELSILVQESHEDYRNKNWREPFYPYWEG